jgi:uncharacterized protein (TIGR02145 family)
MENAKRHCLKFIGLYIVALVVLAIGVGIAFALQGVLSKSLGDKGAYIIWLIPAFLAITVSFGFLKNILNICRGDKVDLVAFIKTNPITILKFFILIILMTIIINIGTALLVIPGVILSIMLLLAPFMVIDRELGPIEAIKESISITSGHKMDIFTGTCLGSLIAILLLIPPLTLFSIPMMLFVYVYPYLQLTGQLDDVPSSPAPVQKPEFQSMPAGYGKKIVIFLVFLALLAGIILIAKNFAGSDVGEKKSVHEYAEKAEKVEKAEESTKSPSFKTVKMPDGKIWMAENLNIETGNSACYSDEPENCHKCGRLYDWVAASTACPKGWHLPSDAEWAALGNAIGNSAGTVLKAKNGWNNNSNGTDDYGFAAFPCGRFYDGKFLHYGVLAFFWTATESDPKNALGSALDANNANLDIGKISKSYKRSVRCVQN